MRTILIWATLAMAVSSPATERVFNFGEYPLDKPLPGFRSAVAGAGKPGDWKVILDEVPPLIAPLNPQAANLNRRPVLAQLARDPKLNRLPLLVFEGETFDDFKLTTRFKIVGGAFEQTAGVVFRYQNESNFYFIGASALGKSFRCSKVVNGEVKPPIGPELEVLRDTWHELTLQCEGNRILASLDGNEAIKLVDSTASQLTGKIGFCTVADSTACFVDAKVTYIRREILAQTLVRDMLKAYPRLVGLKIYAVRPGGTTPLIVASKDEAEVGKAGGETEQDVISHGRSYLSKERTSVSVTVPLRDRNGEPIAAVRVAMKTFPGQTEDNALVRAQPVVKRMQARVPSLAELLQ